jgi:ABC-type multidrug transport system fused ATPase/permease subunit
MRTVASDKRNIVAVLQQGLESMCVVKAFGRQDLEQEELSEVSKATVEAALKARRVKALLSPTQSTNAAHRETVTAMEEFIADLRGTMTAGALTVFLSYLTKSIPTRVNQKH